MAKSQIDNSSARLVSVAERLLSKRLQQELIANQLELTVEQWRILFYLWSEDGISQQNLSQRAKKEKSTTTRQLNDLEKKGLLVRRSHGSDKRNKHIYLTEQGRRIKAKGLRAAQQTVAVAEQGVSPADLAVFNRVVKQFIVNLE